MIFIIYCEVCGEKRKVKMSQINLKDATRVIAECESVMNHKCSGKYKVRHYESKKSASGAPTKNNV